VGHDGPAAGCRSLQVVQGFGWICRNVIAAGRTYRPMRRMHAASHAAPAFAVETRPATW
jgi:hypothetical protein